MNTLRIFLGEFWQIFVVLAPVWSLLQWGRYVSLDGNAAVFAGPSRFKELSGFSKDEQKQLLHAADREAFARWRFWVPTLFQAAIFAGLIAIPLALPSPHSNWASFSVILAAALLCHWVAAWLEVRRIRPFLRSQIEKTNKADGEANGGQPVGSETNRTSSAAGSRH